jgi:hypothetical protein
MAQPPLDEGHTEGRRRWPIQAHLLNHNVCRDALGYGIQVNPLPVSLGTVPGALSDIL